MANTFSVPSTTDAGSTTFSAISGDNQTPYSASVFAVSGAQLTTGDLTVGAAGEVSSLKEFAIEFWWMCNATFPGSAQNIAQGPLSSSVAKNEWVFQIGASNNILFSVVDATGTNRTATGATALLPGVYYHIVGTAQGGSLILYLNGVQDAANAGWGTNQVQTIGTTAGSEDMRLAQNWAGTNTLFDEVATYRTGLTATRVLEHYNAGVNKGRKAELSGTRIGALLDAVSSHAPRTIQAGARSVVPRYYSGQSPLEEMRLALEADDVDAQLWCSKSGGVVFLQDGHRSGAPYNTVQAIFGNAGGSELPYLDLQVSYDVGQVVNQWSVTRTGYQINVPVTQTASDATSQGHYFIRPQAISDVPVIQDSDAATIATALLAKYKDPFYMVTSLKPNMADQQTAETVYSLDLCDRVEVKWTPPGGGSRIDQTVFIQKIEHSGNPNGPPDCTLTVTPF